MQTYFCGDRNYCIQQIFFMDLPLKYLTSIFQLFKFMYIDFSPKFTTDDNVGDNYKKIYILETYSLVSIIIIDKISITLKE